MIDPSNNVRVLLTPGEPAGIGPDIVIDIAEQHFDGELVAVADPELLARRAHALGKSIKLYEADGRPHRSGHLAVIPVALESQETAGELNAANAKYVVETIRKAAAHCVAGDYDAICTAPVHKAVINKGGIAFTGHTELLAELTDSKQPVMLLAAGSLRVALATTHLPLGQVAAAITDDSLSAVIEILLKDLTDKFGIHKPRVSVCGLNPHAGESGLLGAEEIEIIAPVIARFAQAGHRVTGPVPADTAFTRVELANTDAVLAMFHDQGLPVVKHQGFGEAVNVTLGLPIIRTSVDHGTALDLAASGRADSGSLKTAIDLAFSLARSRRRGN